MKKEDKFPFVCLIIYLVIFIMGAINPWNFDAWILESILPVLFVLILIFTYKKFRFSNGSYGLILIFLIFATLGSHYTYSNFPFTQGLFGLERNYYDRIVHFLFGLLGYFPIKEYYKKSLNAISRKKLSRRVIFIILLAGVVFELIEGLAYLTIKDPELISAYLATQGGSLMFDSFNDVLIKTFGGLVALFFDKFFLLISQRINRPDFACYSRRKSS